MVRFVVGRVMAETQAYEAGLEVRASAVPPWAGLGWVFMLDRASTGAITWNAFNETAWFYASSLEAQGLSTSLKF